MDPLIRLQIFRPSMFGGTLEEVLDIQKVNIISDNILQDCNFYPYQYNVHPINGRQLI